jgi:hypothetical protein
MPELITRTFFSSSSYKATREYLSIVVLFDHRLPDWIKQSHVTGIRKKPTIRIYTTINTKKTWTLINPPISLFVD